MVAQRCEPGSADPHGLGDDDTHVARATLDRARAFSVDAHVEASAAELMGRTFVSMNVASTTEAVPAAQREGPGREPPCVNRFEQLCPSAASAKLARWRRQLRRCLRCARQGRLSLARRLRPPDLWMPVSECMHADVRDWDWDTEPLARGEAAVAVQPGARAPDMDVSVAGTRRAAEGFSDMAIVSEIVEGIDDDTDGTIERGTLLCAPHVSGLIHLAQAEGKIAKSVEEGWATVHGSVPRWPLRAVPWGVVDESERAGKPKYRLTIDLSWPHGGMIKGVTSVNDASDRSRWPPARMVRVRDVADGAGVMVASGVPVRAWCIDARAFYRRYGRRQHQLHKQMMVSPTGDWILDRRPQFGGAAVADKLGIRAANLNAHYIKRRLREFDATYPPTDPALVAWVQERRRRAEMAGESEVRWVTLHVIGVYVDDISGCSFDDVVTVDGVRVRRSEAHFKVACAALRELGHESAPEKEQPPSTVCVVLGAELELVRRRLRLSDDKRVRYAQLAEEVAARATCDLPTFRRLVGRLTFASCMYPRGRQWLHACYRTMRARYRLRGGLVRVSGTVQIELQLWVGELRRDGHEGVPLARVGGMPECGEPGTAAIYADASGEVGYGAWAVREDELLLMAGEWTGEQRDGMIIAEKELLASTLALRTLGPLLGADCIFEFTDSTVALAAMVSLTPTLEGMQRLTQQRLLLAERYGWRLAARRVSSKGNLWADLASRGRLADVLRQAVALGLRPRVVPTVTG